MKTPFLHCIYFPTLLFIICAVGCRQDDHLTDMAGISVLEVEHRHSTSFEELAWSPDGRSVAARAYAGWPNSTITVIDLQTGKTRTVYESRRDHFLGPEWSPDGRSLVFDAPTSEANPLSGGVVIIDTDTGDITRDLGFGGHAAWTADSEHIIIVGFTSSCGEKVSIDDYNLTTDVIRTIGYTRGCSPEAVDSLDVSVEGKLVVPNIDGTNTQILDITSGAEQGTMAPMRSSTVWSPDGTMLAFVAKELDSRVETDGIMLAGADGACFSEPLRLNSYLYSVDWSPDGSRLVFSNRDVNRLYFLDLTTGVGKELMDSYRERCAD
jgi:Tol biopolymer transport system component